MQADRQRSRTPARAQVHLEPNRVSGLWKGGEGKYGAIKKISAKASDVKMEEYIGGLRDPYKVVLPRSNMLTIGLKIRAAWELFERQFKEASKVGEQYGTKECSLDDRLIVEWKGTPQEGCRGSGSAGDQGHPQVDIQIATPSRDHQGLDRKKEMTLTNTCQSGLNMVPR